MWEAWLWTQALKVKLLAGLVNRQSSSLAQQRPGSIVLFGTKYIKDLLIWLSGHCWVGYCFISPPPFFFFWISFFLLPQNNSGNALLRNNCISRGLAKEGGSFLRVCLALMGLSAPSPCRWGVHLWFEGWRPGVQRPKKFLGTRKTKKYVPRLEIGDELCWFEAPSYKVKEGAWVCVGEQHSLEWWHASFCP